MQRFVNGHSVPFPYWVTPDRKKAEWKEMGTQCLRIGRKVIPFWRQDGFTLIELLVVIGIISLLSALLFPVFAQAREKARQAVCASNLKQIWVAVDLYAEDNNGIFPEGGDPSDLYAGSSPGTPWASVIRALPLLPIPLLPYVRDNKVWDCPDDFGYTEVGSNETVPLTASPSGFAKYGMSYAYNTELCLRQETLSGVVQYSLVPPYAPVSPSEILLMQDTNGSWHGGTAYEDKRYNALFCDGHVKFVTRATDDVLWSQSFVPQNNP